MKRIFFLFLTIALLVPMNAHAKSFDNSGTTHAPIVYRTPASVNWFPIFEKQAENYWGNGELPACGTPIYQWVDSIQADHPELHGGAAADAQPDTCVIRFETGYWQTLGPQSVDTMCLIVVHELGHLYGHEHSTDPTNVMYPDGGSDWRLVPPCRKAMHKVLFHTPDGGQYVFQPWPWLLTSTNG